MAAQESLPVAIVTHRMTGRVRLKLVPSRAWGKQPFARAAERLHVVLPHQEVSANPVTGTILVQGPDLDLSRIARIGDQEHLFMLIDPDTDPVPIVTRHAKTQVGRIDAGLRKLTGNQLNLSGSVFMVLILHAMGQIVRGNLVVPSWFTALWFATTLYNRDLLGPCSGDD